ncbi:MAG: hypothetical protein ABW034_16055 [Steroidobacteraceae bacterium]
MRSPLTLLCVFLFAPVVMAEDPPSPPSAEATVAANATVPSASGKRATSAAAKPSGEDKTLAGISILGNQEAPKALVIVPWKSSQLAEPQGISKQLDDGRQPVDKDVFMRELSYYEIRTGSK